MTLQEAQEALRAAEEEVKRAEAVAAFARQSLYQARCRLRDMRETTFREYVENPS